MRDQRTTAPRPRRRRGWRNIVLLALLASWIGPLAGCKAPSSASTASAESAVGTERASLESIVLALLDGEALYTVAGGLKPVSSGFWSTRLEVETPDLVEIERVHSGLRSLAGLGSLEFGVMTFAEAYGGKRTAHAWVAHREALRRTLLEHADFFAPHGIGPHQDADEVLAIVERLPRLERFRGYGHLFGYPVYAVDFFVESAAEEERSGKLPGREFAHVPTFGAAQHRFVWAVPAGHVENSADRELRERAAPVLERYRSMRERFIGPGRPGAVSLLRAASRLRPPQPVSSTRDSTP